MADGITISIHTVTLNCTGIFTGVKLPHKAGQLAIKCKVGEDILKPRNLIINHIPKWIETSISWS